MGYFESRPISILELHYSGSGTQATTPVRKQLQKQSNFQEQLCPPITANRPHPELLSGSR